MTHTYLNTLEASHFPFEWHKNDHSHHEFFMISPKSQVSSSTSSSPSIPCTMFSNNLSFDQEVYHHHGENTEPLEHKYKADTFVLHCGSYDHSRLENESDKYGLKLPIWKNMANQNNEDQSYGNTIINKDGSTKSWMSSKMRLMRKMRNSDSAQTATPPNYKYVIGDHKELNSSDPNETYYNISPNNIIRVCSDCNTTKTPLWRSGPRGPKTLCNACGIRQRKARRAMAAAAEANKTILDTPNKILSHVTPKVQNKIKKKRSKKHDLATSSLSTENSPKLCIEDFTLRLSEKYSSFQRVFPQDEKEAAILLMALSYGLVS